MILINLAKKNNYGNNDLGIKPFNLQKHQIL